MNDDHIDKASTPTLDTPAPMNRRALMAGAAGAGLLAAGYLRVTGAQTGTPEAEMTEEAGATPDVSPSGPETPQAAVMLERAQAALVAVEADHDAVASEIEMATVDDVLGQSRLVLDEAQAALNGGDADNAVRLAAGSWHSTAAARDLIVAQLTFAGLPSQEASASHVLARAYERISAVTGTVGAGDANVRFYVTTAQTVYQTAYDQYTDGAYARALANGKAIAALVGTASILAGGDERVLPGMFGDDGFAHRGHDRILQLPSDVQPMPDGDEPETVPAPDF